MGRIKKDLKIQNQKKINPYVSYASVCEEQKTCTKKKVSKDVLKPEKKQQDPARKTMEKSPGIAKKLKEILTHQIHALMEDAVDVERLKRLVKILEKETRIVDYRVFQSPHFLELEGALLYSGAFLCLIDCDFFSEFLNVI